MNRDHLVLSDELQTPYPSQLATRNNNLAHLGVPVSMYMSNVLSMVAQREAAALEYSLHPPGGALALPAAAELELLPAAKKQRVLPDTGLHLRSDWHGMPAGTMLPAGMVVYK